ncbi:hypothetical protein PI95_029755 [Hassallia byssoidea VB512170]|uniref:Uncharacterized protein n=1 Tax=Hassallia byssoidea VB512170 TaxID=1304833 RepID=A0A846HIR6_9CYAN|nr:hypothetical protein [Hassalia byssoidea VB512170]
MTAIDDMIDPIALLRSGVSEFAASVASTWVMQHQFAPLYAKKVQNKRFFRNLGCIFNRVCQT